MSEKEYIIQANQYLRSINRRRVNLANAIVVGPLVTFAAFSGTLSPLTRLGLTAAGIFTIAYNISLYNED